MEILVNIAVNLSLFLGYTFIVRYATGHILELVEKGLLKKLTVELEERINRKKCTLEYRYFEDPQMSDLLENIQDISQKIWACWKSSIGILSSGISLIGILVYLSRIGIIYAGIMILLFIPTFILSIKAGTSYYDTWKRLANFRRRCTYYYDVLLNKQFAQERLLFNYSSYFKEKWENEYMMIRQTSIKEELRGAKKVQISGVLSSLYIIFVMAILLYRLNSGNINIGFFASVITMFPSLYNSTANSISNNINNLIRNYRNVKELDVFFSFEERLEYFAEPQAGGDFKCIEFKNVSFKYPGTDEWVLRHLCLKVEKGLHYAIVGVNGAGKSTIIKLLLRLYHVTEGEILIDGKNIEDFEQSYLYGLMSVLFQDYCRYFTNVRENIGVGDIVNVNDIAKIKASAKKAMIDDFIQNLPRQYETVLGKMNEDGMDLSGGQWQKLAIARLMMSPCTIYILDEPTASLDPVSEYELYKDFDNIMKNKTTIFISHRLSSTVLADRIFVIADKKLIEEGSHDELMKLDGEYCKMFKMQSEMYS
jgi:ABC-type multidrug transport system fused ATPase/permease subunit